MHLICTESWVILVEFAVFCQKNALYLWVLTGKIIHLFIFLWWSYPLGSSYTLKVTLFFDPLQCFFSGCIFCHLIILFFFPLDDVEFISHPIFIKCLFKLFASYINFHYLNSMYGFDYYVTWELFKILGLNCFRLHSLLMELF